MPPAVLAQEVEQLRTEVRGLIAGEALQSEGGREYLKEMVRSVQDEMRTAQRQERQQQWIQNQSQAQAARAERLRKFVSEAGLSYNQEQDLLRRMDAEEARRQALFAEVEAGSKEPRDVRRELRDMRRQTDAEMQKVLSEEQRVKYEELRREERGPGRQGGQQNNRP
jgi:type I site-specific restriction endonuclease